VLHETHRSLFLRYVTVSAVGHYAIHFIPAGLFIILFNYLTQYKTYMVLYSLTLGAFAKLQKSDCWLSHVCLSVRASAHNATPTGRIFMKFEIWVFFEAVSNIQFSLKLTRTNGTLCEDMFTFMVSGWIVIMGNVSNESYRENQNTHCV